MIQDRYGGVPRQHEVAVHAVDEEEGVVVGRGGRGDGRLCGREALCYDSAAINTPCAWRVPERAGVGEYVL